MSDLLRKKSPGLIQRSQTAVPKNTFNIKELETKKEPDTTPVPKKATNSNVIAEKSTTVRVNMSTKNKLNALVTIGIAPTVDDVIDLLINDYHSNILTKDERKQYEIIFELYKSKTK
ncbi:DUF5388 domain-containing protein [Paenisporosarcina sp. OV554]|uniref:DUF5388 domain-containing protein n=1 Tax=Paenisporosarcina sp. OV554 TaxID=2135694 RepID=UPI000D359DA5|nr:DUF5388 domain-containing protein [Paenisporosarcina sp. OV554]PUB09480.1 hypothetical protein C8K15_13032 [Paenisporosarcina sp. OV554]